MSITASLIGISFIATLVRSTFGFGESLVAVPLFALLIPLDVAVPLSVLMSVLVALIVVLQDRRHIHLKSAKGLILYAIAGIPFGLAILAYGNEYWVKLLLGILIVGNSIYNLRKKHLQPAVRDSRRWLVICGFLSGVFGGAYGLNGPPLVVYGNMRQWDPARFRATLQAYFLPVSFLGLLGYGAQGLLGRPAIDDFLSCLPAMIPAVFAGRYFNRKLRGKAFFTYIYCGLIVVGLLLIVVTLNGHSVAGSHR
ncbi:MAG TPA: sulfite exporter TauE/SafE family protein [Puia sp.]|nr:sulfite exporter TauE/SafE family protein [Puia sp.]